jgi:hypothetical protein
MVTRLEAATNGAVSPSSGLSVIVAVPGADLSRAFTVRARLMLRHSLTLACGARTESALTLTAVVVAHKGTLLPGIENQPLIGAVRWVSL